MLLAYIERGWRLLIPVANARGLVSGDERIQLLYRTNTRELVHGPRSPGRVGTLNLLWAAATQIWGQRVIS